MTELLPSLQAQKLRDGLVDFLRTTFALTDSDAANALTEFLTDTDNGIFKGPYLRTRLPFRPAEPGWEKFLGWRPDITPYGHQAAAYQRLTTADLGPEKPRPLPTLVTTGTGSGKTEAFLHPILDHVLRARRDGVRGMKALILYPMNALANDQAGRLRDLIVNRPELGRITAGIYTGEGNSHRTKVTAQGLITDRSVMRDDPPDILLTNYKMLDQLLLRPEDQPIWAKSALSLTYLVLDEFHTYDGAQGTDVAMLLRRLGITLKSHWPSEHPDLTEQDRARPLGRVTPVATSATLGDKGDPATMTGFAETVFGEPFGPGSVVTESRLSAVEWRELNAAASSTLHFGRLADLTGDDITALAARCETQLDDGAELTRTVLAELVTREDGSDASSELAAADMNGLLALAKELPDVQWLVENSADATSIEEIRLVLFGSVAVPVDPDTGRLAIELLIAALSHLRAACGRSALGVELTLWVRELSRIDRRASAVAEYRWSDDGELVAATVEDDTLALPAIYCRQCGRSGWGIELAATGLDLGADDTGIRRTHMAHEGRFRPLIFAPAEDLLAAELAASSDPAWPVGLSWLSTTQRQLLTQRPADDTTEVREGHIIPVLTHLGTTAEDDSRRDRCPSCGERDSIRFLGSRIATLLSVNLSTIFGARHLDAREKKALVFTDSVQDAAHRAGFIEARSHSLTLRGVLRDAVGETTTTLDVLTDDVVQRAGDDRFKRYRLLPPELAGRDNFTPFWREDRISGVPGLIRSRVKQRLLLDASLEVGLQSTFGRTLLNTGSIGVHVSAGSPAKLASLGREATRNDDADGAPTQLDSFGAVDDATLTAWVRGVLEHMRLRGGISHPWLAKYLQEDGRRFLIWGGRAKAQGMPAFPAGRAAPAFPRVGPALTTRDPLLDPVTSSQSWYAVWAAKTLGVSAVHGARLARSLLATLAQHGVLETTTTTSKATVYAIAPSAVALTQTTTADLEGGRTLLVCNLCYGQVSGSPTLVEQLHEAPCMVARCHGTMQGSGRGQSFYRDLYAVADPRRIVAREHTGLLDDVDRVTREERFKASSTEPDAPNVLVATPTLEMGIDIGDLSTVVLASLPAKVSAYLQRVGRAGRLTGNALHLAFVSGRGEQLPKLGEPLSVIDGEVRPPATYLDAVEILQRQYVASLIDAMARDGAPRMPRTATGALGSTDAASFLGELMQLAESSAPIALPEFLGAFPTLRSETGEALQAWVRPQVDADGAAVPLSSGLATLLLGAHHAWNTRATELAYRKSEIEVALPALIAAAESPAATDEDRRARRSTEAAYKMVQRELGELRRQHWVAALEEFGVLPNYTLHGDVVALDAHITWVDPDTGQYEAETRTIERAGLLALRELSPGAQFYASGLSMTIDGVDLGRKGEEVRVRAFCAACGYSVAVDGVPSPSHCPRCQSVAIADTAQRMDSVELTRVMSEVRRDEQRIDDRSDDRVRTDFAIVTTVDLDPDHVTSAWSTQTGLGVRRYRQVDIRWVNLGRRAAGVMSRQVAGFASPARLFRVCDACGKVDLTAGVNGRDEHRPWCVHRTSVEEHTRDLALVTTLQTQGVVITFPETLTMSDRFALPSLSAAVMLGLRETMGGSPDHLRLERIQVPVEGGPPGYTIEGLLLHDTVPGGTGYLGDMSSAQWVWSLLQTAHRIVDECPCAEEGRFACHRCLLPYAGREVEWVSRVTARNHLASLLGLAESTNDDASVADSGDMTWVVKPWLPPPVDPESVLEKRFREALTTRLEALNATVKTVPSADGNVLRITGVGERTWTVRPQQLVHGCQPDFVLGSNDPSIAQVAIFTDGWAYHASPAHNRLRDDAQKRAALRDYGYEVLAVTHADLEGTTDLWVTDQAVSVLMSAGLGVTSTARDALRGGPLDMLMSWIHAPHDSARGELADRIWMLMAPTSRGLRVPRHGDLAELAESMMNDDPVFGTDANALWWRQDQVGLLTRYDGNVVTGGALVLNDSSDVVGLDAHRAAWQRWLQLSNATIGASPHARPRIVTTSMQAVDEQIPTAPSATVASDLQEAEIWSSVDKTYLSEMEKVIAGQLVQLGVEAPEVGIEVGDGVPVSFAWLGQRVVTIEGALDDAVRGPLESDGWTVISLEDVTAVRDALMKR